MIEEPHAQLKKVYPEFSLAELAVAAETLDRYLELAWEIFEDATLGDVSQAAFAEPVSQDTMKERSILPTN